jgi:hypothetical protein
MKEASDYGARLKALRDEQRRLEQRQIELLEKRRTEIGRLAEKLGILEADDDTVAGVFLELKTALSNPAGDERLRHWRTAGASFRRGNKDRKAPAPQPGVGLEQSDQNATRR